MRRVVTAGLLLSVAAACAAEQGPPRAQDEAQADAAAAAAPRAPAASAPSVPSGATGATVPPPAPSPAPGESFFRFDAAAAIATAPDAAASDTRPTAPPPPVATGMGTAMVTATIAGQQVTSTQGSFDGINVRATFPSPDGKKADITISFNNYSKAGPVKCAYERRNDMVVEANWGGVYYTGNGDWGGCTLDFKVMEPGVAASGTVSADLIENVKIGSSGARKLAITAGTFSARR